MAAYSGRDTLLYFVSIAGDGVLFPKKNKKMGRGGLRELSDKQSRNSFYNDGDCEIYLRCRLLQVNVGKRLATFELASNRTEVRIDGT